MTESMYYSICTALTIFLVVLVLVKIWKNYDYTVKVRDTKIGELDVKLKELQLHISVLEGNVKCIIKSIEELEEKI